MTFRTERDSLGDRDVPADAYYGIQTTRAVENFPISGLHAPPDLVSATIHVKRAAAVANRDLGRLDRRVADAVVAATYSPTPVRSEGWPLTSGRSRAISDSSRWGPAQASQSSSCRPCNQGRRSCRAR